MDRLKGKVAVVAGAGSIALGWSNGKATAALFAREGAKVFAVDRELSAAEETKSVIAGEGGECTAFRADVSAAKEVDAMVAACLAAYGRIDVLFNNVGLQVVGGPLEITEADWDRLMTAKIRERLLQVPAGRLGDAWDVAYAVLYLASDESRFVTATELVVDGGQSASVTGKIWSGP